MQIVQMLTGKICNLKNLYITFTQEAEESPIVYNGVEIPGKKVLASFIAGYTLADKTL